MKNLKQKDLRSSIERYNDFVTQNEHLIILFLIISSVTISLVTAFLLGGSSNLENNIQGVI